jgi:hypothetical protein
LSDGVLDPFVDMGGVAQISDEHPNGAWDLLFLKIGHEFKFYKKKLYAPDLYKF